MQIAIISDVHANLEALQTVFEYTRQHDIETVFCLGDSVGYGPNPNECVTLIKEHCTHVIMGNHDYAAVGLANTEFFNINAKSAIAWTRNQLTTENTNFLKKLPFTTVYEHLLLTHASPKSPSSWEYVLTHQAALKQFKVFKQNICFIGHSHVPIIYTPSAYFTDKKIILERGESYIVNVGSVGQPRDGDPRTCFVLLDTETNSLEYIRLKYDTRKTSEKIKNAGLPSYLADRILYGQ
ncbi:MAG TPA: metallophosphoesterase [Caldithrix abyssi]|uniref:Metallophosphoesterase n=1 Tax=Caldithrix abyssi TaxID=187145 RepID=A0A7V1LKH2_CALAY|nr:metallophosphoesterase [Caldithrix abyssi]